MGCKILIISHDFPEIIGGVSGHTFFLAKELSKNNKVSVLTSLDGRISAKDADNFAVFPEIERWGFVSLPKIIHKINMIKPDWVFLQYVPHMYSRYTVPLYIAVLSIVIKMMGCKLLTNFHEIGLRMEITKIRIILAAILQRMIASIIALYSNKIIVSIGHYKNILWFFRKKIYKIPIGSNILPIHLSEEEKNELRKNLLSSKKILISTFGMAPKRNDLLVDLATELKAQKIEAKFLLIGAFSLDFVGMMKKKAKYFGVEDYFYFTGFLESKEVYKHLSASDIFLALEDMDKKGHGGVSIKSCVIASAYAAGLPIIANKGDMTDDFFKHKENMFLINTLNIGEIVQAIKELINDEAFREKLRRAAIKTYQEKLDWSVIVSQYAVIIKS